MRARAKLKRPPIGRGLMLGAVMLSASCAMQGGSETERSICRELRADLPSYSRQDTAQTLEEGARFQLVFAGVCG
ncbi:hypothetical protein [Falsigemmobacter faecalis]|uniref:Uncharacterized protein n=1 Tax=Falsigemmobacter faecalis TaxID=2488730 RepID=A0A3P3D6T7_9RHOB|nr:hypothetical protein [Falsigemmobacter faecalis]RRH70039.1 hypothetical protein EG244_17675 [Falsigemmobacter faecalis]